MSNDVGMRKKPSNKWIQAELAKQGFRMVPISHITEVEQLAHRFDAFSTSITVHIDAVLGKELLPLLTEIRAELRDHRHILTDHGHRLTALEKHVNALPCKRSAKGKKT